MPSCLIKNKFDKFISVIIILGIVLGLHIVYVGLCIQLFYIFFLPARWLKMINIHLQWLLTTYQYRIIQA